MPTANRKPLEGFWTEWLSRLGGVSVPVLAASLLAGNVHAQTPPAPAVTVATPLSREVPDSMEHTARILPSARVEIRPRVSGQVAQVHFTDGALVRPGDLLFTIDQRPFRIAVEQARAELGRAEARLTLAGQQLARSAPLVRERYAPEAELDTRRSARQEAEAGLAGARAALRQAELSLEWTEIRAPRAGRVSDRRVDAGNLVREGDTLLTTLLALDPIYISFDMSEAEQLRLARRGQGRAGGLQANLRLLDENEFSREGTVDFTDSAFDNRSGTIRARAVFPNADLFLTPGAFARLRVTTGGSPALLIPDAAVVADQAGRVVLTVQADGTVVPKPVRLGPLVDGLRVVQSGLAPDERVIIAGLHRARPGARVTAEPGRIGPSPFAAR
ncbi:efflux RND transporter periplasmic adaptor subunit [Rhodovarius crocodyli]|uniref:Efflux RND transporter periplasmic adaptor subunit n=1 Tax=Rhodovarius crocodyli TaxID=1979269 RepID=A0A437M255_9PROT|nr:efflux RND transporter periplasmic adaptor subunit [Rhodovarius crocodyli]RVT91800.1 efflux RND transporter periplasmic adaptor subunit [Rhodovarius crocodyli]